MRKLVHKNKKDTDQYRYEMTKVASLEDNLASINVDIIKGVDSVKVGNVVNNLAIAEELSEEEYRSDDDYFDYDSDVPDIFTSSSSAAVSSSSAAVPSSSAAVPSSSAAVSSSSSAAVPSSFAAVSSYTKEPSNAMLIRFSGYIIKMLETKTYDYALQEPEIRHAFDKIEPAAVASISKIFGFFRRFVLP
ncbi:hypothetical protein, partial, partial [Absidia glauca]